MYNNAELTALPINLNYFMSDFVYICHIVTYTLAALKKMQPIITCSMSILPEKPMNSLVNVRKL